MYILVHRIPYPWYPGPESEKVVAVEPGPKTPPAREGGGDCIDPNQRLGNGKGIGILCNSVRLCSSKSGTGPETGSAVKQQTPTHTTAPGPVQLITTSGLWIGAIFMVRA